MPPQVFVVDSPVSIHVQASNARYELVLVRMGAALALAQDVRPPIEHIVTESGSCLGGDVPADFKIHTEAVYSDIDARQVFLVESP